jgi:hypothetical protein
MRCLSDSHALGTGYSAASTKLEPMLQYLRKEVRRLLRVLRRIVQRCHLPELVR